MQFPKDIEGVIFDMDGTLIDSMGMWRDSGDLYLNAFGIEKTKEFPMVKFNVEYNDLTQAFMEYYGIERDLSEVKRDTELLVSSEYFHKLPLKNGVERVLHALKARGIKMTVATATNAMLAKMCFRRLGILDYFEAVISTKDIGVNKYHPDIYRLCAEKMGTSPQKTAVFEDALYAARTAAADGFRVFGVYDSVFDEGFRELARVCEDVFRQYDQIEF